MVAIKIRTPKIKCVAYIKAPILIILDGVTRKLTYTGDVDGNNTEFILDDKNLAANTIMVYKGGQKLNSEVGSYVYDNVEKITFEEAPTISEAPEFYGGIAI